MAKIQYTSLGHELYSRGYLSMSKAVLWLSETHPEVAVSYPTFSKMVKAGKIEVLQVGGITRVMAEELERYVLHGNRGSSEEAES